MHIILFFLFLFVSIFAIGVLIISFILRAIFGIGRYTTGHRQSKRAQTGQRGYTNERYSDTKNEYSAGNDGGYNKREKIFSKDEGEYIDFEEIKE